MNADDRAQMTDYLTQQGHTPEEIERVLAKLREHDRQTIHESIFDSIERGSFNLQQIIAEAKSAPEQDDES